MTEPTHSSQEPGGGSLDAGDPPINVIVHKPPAIGWRAWIPNFRAIELGAAVALIVFLHDAVWVPSTLPASVTVTALLTELHAGPPESGFADLTAYQADIHVKNAGSRRVSVLAAEYEVWGVHLARRLAEVSDPASPTPSPSASAEPPAVLTDQGLCGLVRSNRYVDDAGGPQVLLSSGRFLEGSWFDAGQETDERPVFYARQSDFDVLRMVVAVYVAKGDLVTQSSDEPVAWGADALYGDSSALPCQYDFAGDLTARPLHSTSWKVRSPIPVIGFLFDPIDRLVVEWRPVSLLGRTADGGPCDPYGSGDSGQGRCGPYYLIGPMSDDSSVEPFIAVCDGSDCTLTDTMNIADELKLAESGPGLNVSSAVADVVLWQDSPKQATPSP